MSRMIRNFCEMLGLLSRREFSRRLDEELTLVLDALETMQADAGKAKITVEIVFSYELGRIDIIPTFKTKLPETAKFMKTPFWTIDGALSVQHPNQIDMFPARVTRDDDDESVAG